MFEREVAIYRDLKPHLQRITFVTYGGAQDLRYAEQLGDIHVVCNRWALPRHWYLFLLTRFYPVLWRGCGVIKSNQVDGAAIALKAARRSGNKFIARCGYLLSDFMEREHGMESHQAHTARTYEQQVFGAADRVVVTTRAMRDAVVQRYQVETGRVTIIPNYVDTNLFRPNSDRRGSLRRIGFVGRLEKQKNPCALVDAVKGLGLELVMVGNGSLAKSLQQQAEENGVKIQFLGNVPHQKLPEILNSIDLFVLPSHYEGHPKALIEAMACGLPVLGAGTPGIRDLVRHGSTGWLCGTEASAIRAGIQDLLSHPVQSAELGHNARQYVLGHFSLDQVVDQELNLFQEVLS